MFLFVWFFLWTDTRYELDRCFGVMFKLLALDLMWMFQPALLTCQVMYRQNTFHPWFFSPCLDSAIPCVCVCVCVCVTVCDLGTGPAACRQCAASVWTVVSVWHWDCRLSTGIFRIAAIKYLLSEYFHNASHSQQDGDTLWRHDKIKKIALFFFHFSFFFLP